jgi:hypothetical protein
MTMARSAYLLPETTTCLVAPWRASVPPTRRTRTIRPQGDAEPLVETLHQTHLSCHIAVIIIDAYLAGTLFVDVRDADRGAVHDTTMR